MCGITIIVSTTQIKAENSQNALNKINSLNASMKLNISKLKEKSIFFLNQNENRVTFVTQGPKGKKNLLVTKLSINQIRQFLYIMNSNQRKEQCLKQIQTFAVYIIPS